LRQDGRLDPLPQGRARALANASERKFMSENIRQASDATFEKDVPQSKIKHVSDASFEKDVLQSTTPVLVDYWAEWCGPCKMIAPVLEDMAKEYAGRLTVAKLDIDANPEITSQFGIRGIPTLILFKSGKPHAQKVGALSKSQLAAFVDSNL